jgi:Na+-transporting NADH:ubiquinone oxidoreductase subunit NqrE
MNTPGKWLTRAGALALLLGFFLPLMTVSCSVVTEINQSVSLADLAGQRSVLYLIVLGGLAILVLSVIPAASNAIAFQFLLGQAGGLFSLSWVSSRP